MPVISMKQLLEAGVHFGHQSNKWNPKMKKYIFTTRNDIHIINLEDTSVFCDKAYFFIRDIVASGKNVLFVGTKKQAQEAVEADAKRCGMFYIVNRWLGGTLTNFKTIRSRVARLKNLARMEETGEFNLLSKKEVAGLKAEMDKLEKNLGGIKEMTELPGVLFVVDPKKEHIAVSEARALNIPVVGIVDTNCDPDDVDFIIPANDDAMRSVKLIVGAMADAVIEAKEGVSPRLDAEQTEGAQVAEETNQDEVKMTETTQEVVKQKENKEEK